jgi:hypothetical protein
MVHGKAYVEQGLKKYEEKVAQTEQRLLQKLARKYNMVLKPKAAWSMVLWSHGLWSIHGPPKPRQSPHHLRPQCLDAPYAFSQFGSVNQDDYDTWVGEPALVQWGSGTYANQGWIRYNRHAGRDEEFDAGAEQEEGAVAGRFEPVVIAPGELDDLSLRKGEAAGLRASSRKSWENVPSCAIS